MASFCTKLLWLWSFYFLVVVMVVVVFFCRCCSHQWWYRGVPPAWLEHASKSKESNVKGVRRGVPHTHPKGIKDQGGWFQLSTLPPFLELLEHMVKATKMIILLPNQWLYHQHVSHQLLGESDWNFQVMAPGGRPASRPCNPCRKLQCCHRVVPCRRWCRPSVAG